MGALSTLRPLGNKVCPLEVVPLPLDDFLNTPLGSIQIKQGSVVYGQIDGGAARALEAGVK